ncbi:hypothetical protein H5410_060810 [Solanum commersonii]|uniref:Uncharacterized protein n=1 Tax=Solanum commersonii TaxID=4109 RepID=A0A9J5W751_SOLCO|nr:hypothetical protein H5410_060810 [Solanum commersonii]
MSLDLGGNSTPEVLLSVKILILWNCTGADNANFRNNLRALIEWNNLTVLDLMETSMQDHNNILHALNFTDVIQVPTVGYSGGMTLFWKNTKVAIEPYVLTGQEIH